MGYGNDESIEYMYKLINAMTRLGYPVMFKGAMVLRSITEGKVNTTRMTRDLDLEWKMEDTTNPQLLGLIREALYHCRFKEELIVEQKRKFGNGRSASFVFKEKGSSLIKFSMDIKIDARDWYSTEYVTATGLRFSGASIEKITIDKLMVVSKHLVYRRTKDVYDLYLLSHFSGIRLQDIVQLMQTLNSKLGDFDDFLNGVDTEHGIRYSYLKLQDIVNKPDFDVVYPRVKDFCRPFIELNNLESINLVWNCDLGWNKT